jgi:hypothetical protein
MLVYTRNLSSGNLKDQLELAAARMRTRHVPNPPPPPPPAVLKSLWTSRSRPLKEELPSTCTEVLTGSKRSTALPPVVQEEAVRAAKDMRKAQAQQIPPLAPAAPAPVLVAGEAARTIEQQEVRAAQEMNAAHYPPLAPANPAPDTITKDAVASTPLKEVLLPTAIKTMQNVEPAPSLIPDAPPPPAPMQLEESQFVMRHTLKEDLAFASEEHHLHRRQEELRRTHRWGESSNSAEPVAPRSAVPPPLPPRPAVRGDAVVHEKQKVIQHQPILEKEVINERPVQVKHQHHIQPVVHEVEHSIQPIVKTQATTATTVIEKDKNVMFPPIVEPTTMVSSAPVAAALVPTSRRADAGMLPATHVPMTPQGMMMGGRGMLDSEERMGLGVVAPIMPGEKEILLEDLSKKEKKRMKKNLLSPSTATDSALQEKSSPTAGTGGRRGSIGMKIKGAVKEVAGTITRNPAKKEEGKMLMHGIDPATNTSRV